MAKKKPTSRAASRTSAQKKTSARKTAGKPPAGTVSLTIARDGEDVVVRLEDDGAGIDPARIRTTAIARGVIGKSASRAHQERIKSASRKTAATFVRRRFFSC